MKPTATRGVLLIVVSAVLVTSCDSSPLVAPVASTISVTASASALQPGGTAEVAAYVVEEAGTLVHNGTVVRFSSTLGQVDPVEAKTRDGVAFTTFTAGGALGTARIVASSGGALPAEGQSNAVDIVISTAP